MFWFVRHVHDRLAVLSRVDVSALAKLYGLTRPESGDRANPRLIGSRASRGKQPMRESLANVVARNRRSGRTLLACSSGGKTEADVNFVTTASSLPFSDRSSDVLLCPNELP